MLLRQRFSDAAGTIFLWKAETEEIVRWLSSHDGRVEEVDWSPDGRLLALPPAGPEDAGCVHTPFMGPMGRMMIRKTVALNQGEIHIWYVSINGHQKNFDWYRKLLSPSERKRVEKLRFKESRRSYTVCRGILREILSCYVGKMAQDLEIKKMDTGKPYVPHSRIQFNLSHSDDSLLCGVTRGNPIGVDCQAVYKISNMDTLVGDFFSSQEKQLYDQFKEIDPSDFFFKTWVRKEAFMKATGFGFHLPSQLFSTRTANEGEPSLRFHCNNPLSLKNWSLRDIPVQSGYKAAFAVRGAVEEVEYFPYIH